MRLVAGRENAARRAEFDPVGACPDDLADAQPHRLDTIDDHIWPVWQGDVEVASAQEMRVGMAAGLAQSAHCDEHPRAWKVPGVDGHPYTCRRAGGVPHRGEPRLQGAARGPHGSHELEGRRGGEL